MIMHFASLFALAAPLQIAANQALDTFRGVSQVAATSLINAAWQGALLAGLLTIAIKLAPRTTAAVRFTLWSVAFLAVLLLPLLRLYSPAGVAASAPVALTAHPSPAPLLQVDVRWGLLIAVLWLAASLFRATRLAVHIVRLTNLWRSAKPLSAEQYPTLAATSRRFEICTTQKLDRPGVIGFFAPRILIPEWLFAQLSPAELRQVILHEMEHLRRRDDWTNLVQRLCLIVFPLNPALYWIERQLCSEREMACDEGVIGLTHAPRAYATCLTRLAERGLHHRTEALSLGAWQRRPELARRIHSILRGQQTIPPRGTQALIAAVACALVFVSVELSHSPQLVAFVPTQPRGAELASATHLASIPTAQKFDVAQVVAQSVDRSHLTSRDEVVRPHLTQTRVTLPVASATPAFTKHVPTLPMRPSAAPAEVETAVSAPISPFPAENGSQSQWIVFTTVEQESVAGDRAQLDQPTQSTAIVTQVVFHIITHESASPSNPAPEAAPRIPIRRAVAYWPPRSGWLIFQL